MLLQEKEKKEEKRDEGDRRKTNVAFMCTQVASSNKIIMQNATKNPSSAFALHKKVINTEFHFSSAAEIVSKSGQAKI